MDLYKAFEEEVNKFIAALLASLLAWLIVFFRKLPKYIITNIISKRQLRAITTGSKINNILSDLADRSGAIYVHIIRYHNGGKEMSSGRPVNMTVDWEEVGGLCLECTKHCNFYKRIRKIQYEWQNQPVAKDWFKIVDQTITHKNHVSEFSIDEMDVIHEEIWKEYGIDKFREVFIKHTTQGFYTLGLSFCSNNLKTEISNGMMIHVAGQLKNLL